MNPNRKASMFLGDSSEPEPSYLYGSRNRELLSGFATLLKDVDKLAGIFYNKKTKIPSRKITTD
jgi:hypothetical protein